MHLTGALLSTLALAACHASAFGVRKRDGLTKNLEILVPRQLFNKNQCEDICRVFETSLDSCTDNICLCSIAVASALQNCINCSVRENPIQPVINSANSIADPYNGVCGPYGIPAITIPSGSSSRSMISITSSRGSSTSSSRITAPATVSAGASLGVTPTSTVSRASNAGSGPQSTVSGNLPFPSSISQIIIRSSDTESLSPSSSATGDDSGTPTSMGLRNGMDNSLSVMLSAALGIWFLLPV